MEVGYDGEVRGKRKRATKGRRYQQQKEEKRREPSQMDGMKEETQKNILGIRGKQKGEGERMQERRE